jgi:hypothetical protein
VLTTAPFAVKLEASATRQSAKPTGLNICISRPRRQQAVRAVRRLVSARRSLEEPYDDRREKINVKAAQESRAFPPAERTSWPRGSEVRQLHDKRNCCPRKAVLLSSRATTSDGTPEAYRASSQEPDGRRRPRRNGVDGYLGRAAHKGVSVWSASCRARRRGSLSP